MESAAKNFLISIGATIVFTYLAIAGGGELVIFIPLILVSLLAATIFAFAGGLRLLYQYVTG